MNTADEPDHRHAARLHAGIGAAPAAHGGHRQVDIWKRRRFGNPCSVGSGQPLLMGSIIRTRRHGRLPAHGAATVPSSPGRWARGGPSPTPTPWPPRRPRRHRWMAGALTSASDRRWVDALPDAAWSPHARPADAPTLRWGILAPGGIARAFATALQARTGQHLQAVASRSRAGRRPSPTTSGSRRPTAPTRSSSRTPTSTSSTSPHRTPSTATTRCSPPLRASRCSSRRPSPGTPPRRATSSNPPAAQGLSRWRRCGRGSCPTSTSCASCLEDGLLGEVHTVHADHGQALHPDGPQRLSDPALAGGALLDLGSTRSRSPHLCSGTLTDVTATGSLTELGGRRAGGDRASRTSTGAIGCPRREHGDQHPDRRRRSVGTQARLELDGPVLRPSRPSASSAPTTRCSTCWSPRDREHGLHFEAAEVARCIAAGHRVAPHAAGRDAARSWTRWTTVRAPDRGPLPRRVSGRGRSDQGQVGRSRSARCPLTRRRPGVPGRRAQLSAPVATSSHVWASVSTTLGGVPRVWVVPATHCTAPNGGTRTSTLRPGATVRQLLEGVAHSRGQVVPRASTPLGRARRSTAARPAATGTRRRGGIPAS